MKRALFFILLVMIAVKVCAVLVLNQDFEGSAEDNWGYIADPPPSRMVWWGPTDQPLGGATAQSRDWYWASWDLDNITHSLSFDPVPLSKLYSYTIKFYYYSRNLNPDTDAIRFCLEYDTGSAWQKWVNLLPNTNEWTLVTIEIPPYAQNLRFRLEGAYDGMNKYLHWDNIRLEAEQIEADPPFVYNVNAAQRRDGSKIVDIHYDIIDVNLDPATISLILSTDGGTSFTYSPSVDNLSGDIGDNILTGEGKHIVWNAGAEGVDFLGEQYRIRILADDHTILGTMDPPTLNPPTGAFMGEVAVRIRTNSLFAQIYYTLDGSEPTLNSSFYTGPVTINQSCTLKARVFQEGWDPSEVISGNYSIIPLPPPEFVRMNGGTFTMGRSVGEGFVNELPLHTVSVGPFYMSKFEVTQLEYETTMAYLPQQDSGVGPTHPVHRINWYDTLVYCNKRSINEGLVPVYSIAGSTNPDDWGEVPYFSNATWNAVVCDWTASGYRLPTEAEWEYAARGGTNNPDYLYSGSNDINTVAWYVDNATTGVRPVGLKAANGLGLHDMSGNVTEFVWDWYSADYYSVSPTQSPTGPSTGLYRLGRGGGWNTSAFGCRIAFRPSAAPEYTHINFGFRICRRGTP